MSLLLEKSPHTVEAFENENGYFIKTFLLDDSVAKNGMGVNPEYIPKHINKFMGKPVVLTPDFYHPHEFDHYQETGDPTKDLEEYVRLQAPYIIGTISDVNTNSKLHQASGTNYSAILKIEDQKAIAAFKQGKIPLYVSPSIYRVHNKDPVHSITDYEPLHIAIVDNPAYGFHRANIRAQCEGTKDTCSARLAQAGIFCKEAKLSELKNVLQASIPIDPSVDIAQQIVPGTDKLREISSTLSKSSAGTNSSFTSFVSTKDNNSMTEDNSVTVPPAKEEQKQQETATVEQKIQEQKAQVTPINTPIPNVSGEQVKTETPKTEEAAPAQSNEELPCEKAKREYEEKLAAFENDIKSWKEFKANYEKTTAENKIQSKRSRIENIVPKEYANSDEERAKAIESLMKVEDEQLEVILNSFVIPATKNIKQGGLVRKKVTDFVKPIESNKQIAQASVSKLGAKDIENLEKILDFGYGGIVPTKKNSGGIA